MPKSDDQQSKRRRGHGEGGIYQRAKDGLWVAALDLGWEGGKRRRRYFYAKTRREVALKLARAQHDHDRGLPIAPERLTVATFLDRWLEEAIKPRRKPSTYQSYGQYVRLHISPMIGDLRLGKLNARDIQALLVDRQRYGLAPRSVSYILTILRMALRQAEKWDLVPRNVAELVDRPATSTFTATVLTPEHARRLVDAAHEDRLDGLITVGVALGLRKGEMLGLQWGDVDLEAGTLRVRQQIQRVDKKPQFVPPKSESGKRTIALPATCIAALRNHQLRQVEDRLLAGSRWRGDEWQLVFPSTIGTPMDGRNLDRSFHRLLNRAGLPHMRFHDLRHSAGTIMMAMGIPQRVVMGILGHSSMQMTTRYLHALPELMRDAADQMDALFVRDNKSS